MTSRLHILLPSVLVTMTLATASAADGDDAALRKTILRHQIDLADSKEVYAVLDPTAGEIRLELSSVVLRRFPAAISVGEPRKAGGGALHWSTLIFTLESGMPEMERPTIVPASADGAAPDTTKPVGPTEDLLKQRDRLIASVPAHYVLEFSPHLEMLVAGEEDTRSTWEKLRERFHNVMARLRGQELPMRVRLQVTADDARRFGLATRQGMKMLVLPPLPNAAAAADRG